jgi:hypothetical protein
MGRPERRATVQIVKEESELRVMTPNEPGIYGRVLGTLANAGINLRAICVSSEGKKGIFQLITANNAKAERALRTLGYSVRTRKVVTMTISDRIGAGAEIGLLLGNAVIDIKSCYGTSGGGGQTLLVFQTNNNRKAVHTLK